MLKNIIFDMGNVLTEYNPERFVERIDIDNKTDREQLLREIFQSNEWKLVDKGELTEAQLEKIVFGRIGEHLHTAAHRLIFGWDELSEPIEGMAQFVRDCKEAGLGIYLLSNASLRQPSYWVNIPGSEYFDGAIVSAFHLCLKPSPQIYQIVLKNFHLKAEECLFVDDMPENVAGAVREGIHGFQFCGDVDELRDAVQKLGVVLNPKK